MMQVWKSWTLEGFGIVGCPALSGRGHAAKVSNRERREYGAHLGIFAFRI
jgi:hypothetical protein